MINDSGNYFISGDSRGFIWISSLNGFYRYDGLELKHFLIPANNKGGFIPDQTVQSAFFEDPDGNLWFTTYNSLHCFERKNSRIKNFRPPSQDGEETDFSYHLFHFEKTANRLWLRAGEQVWVYDVNSDAWDAKFSSPGIRFSAFTDTAGDVNMIIGCPWLKGPLTVSRKTPGGDWVSENYLDDRYEIRSAIPYNDSVTWLLSNHGLIEFNLVSGVPLAHYPQTDDHIPLNLFSGLAIKNNRFFLLGTQNDGIRIFDARQRIFLPNREKKEDAGHVFSTIAPRGFFMDDAGLLWVGQKEGGVDYFKLLMPDDAQTPFSSINSWSEKTTLILQDKKENIWLMNGAGEIFCYSSSHSRLDPIKSSFNSPFLHFAIDSANSIWANTAHSVYRLKESPSGSTGQWELILSSDMQLVSVFPDIPGRVLIVTRKGIFDLIKINGKFQLAPAREFSDYPGFNFLRLYKPGDQVLIPYQSKELWVARLNGNSLMITEKLKIGGVVYGAWQSPLDGSLWIGANIGLFCYHREQLSQVLNSLEDLGGANIYGVFGTPGNVFWLSTSRGIRKFQVEPRRLTGIYQSDGLPDEQFSEYAFLRSSDGRIWLGAAKGAVVFHPDSVAINSPEPKVHIEAVWVNNTPFEPENAISETEALDLNYRENTLSFELRAVNFYYPELNTLACRLIGYDETFTAIKNGGVARFTKIPPGRYTLEVTGINAQGLEGEKKQLRIHIRPPFWQTLWFKISFVLAFLLTIAAITGAYYRRKLRKQQQLLERQKALSEERSRIAKELHDDMGSSLSSILFLSEDLLTDTPAEQSREIRRISDLAESSMENMREIIWALDTGKNTFQDLAIRLRAFATGLLADSRIGLELDLSTEDAALGGEYRRNIYLVAKEGLHNIVKHAQASLVKISLKLENGQIVLEIRDNGRGFDNSRQETSGYGLNNMNSRAAAIGGTLEIRSVPEEGTLLRLCVFYNQG